MTTNCNCACCTKYERNAWANLARITPQNVQKEWALIADEQIAAQKALEELYS